MTDATGGHVQPDEEKRRVIEEEKRRVIENAKLASRPEVARQHPREPPPTLASLADAPNISRLVKHRRLIDGLRRCPADDRAGLDEHAGPILASTLEQDLPDRAKHRLAEVVAAPGAPRLQPQHWQQWVQSTDDIFRFTTHERTFEACDDEQLVMKATPGGHLVPSRLIIAQFWSHLPPADFRTYVDPQNWPQCSPFWRSMKPLGPIVRTVDGYDGDFEEKVDIIGVTLTVPLHIGFRTLPDQSRVWTRFNISHQFYDQDTPVDVDTGTVSAELVPGGPASTRVRATKYLHWRDPSQPDLTAQACDFGWSDLMEEMAYGCAQGSPMEGQQAEGTGTDGQQAEGTGTDGQQAEGTGTDGQQAEGTGADGATRPVGDAIKQLVVAVTTQCQEGISDNGAHLEQLIGRFTGSSWDAGWINDLLGMGLVTTRRYGNIASDVRRFADSLRDAASERGGHG
jgi:hypothetical protein